MHWRRHHDHEVAFASLAGWPTPHAFSLRWRPDGRPLQLGGDGGRPDQIAAARRALLLAAGFAGRRLVLPRQRHTAVARLVASADDRPGVCDALITNRAEVVLGIQTADCVPVLVVDPRARAVAAVHAGWRGTLAGVLTRTLELMSASFGSDPGQCRVALGPAIGGCCYEVGPEVERQFAERWPEALDRGPTGRARLDLARVNLLQAVAAGVPADQILSSGACTRCREQEFPSYRRDGAGCGRILSLIGVA
jgi:hypothetical protein